MHTPLQKQWASRPSQSQRAMFQFRSFGHQLSSLRGQSLGLVGSADFEWQSQSSSVMPAAYLKSSREFLKEQSTSSLSTLWLLQSLLSLPPDLRRHHSSRKLHPVASIHFVTARWWIMSAAGLPRTPCMTTTDSQFLCPSGGSRAEEK